MIWFVLHLSAEKLVPITIRKGRFAYEHFFMDALQGTC